MTIEQIELSKEQSNAIDRALDWQDDYNSCRIDQQVFKILGPAGTGKSALACYFARQRGAAAVTLTGKAASVLRRRGAPNPQTIHKFLYEPPIVIEGERRSLLWELQADPADASLIVLDELSMVDHRLGDDLLRRRIPVLAFGDSIQLPPINGRDGFFDQFPADIKLRKIHRQAANSQPLRLATQIREGGALPQGKPFDTAAMLAADQVVVALNRSRISYNVSIR